MLINNEQQLRTASAGVNFNVVEFVRVPFKVRIDHVKEFVLDVQHNTRVHDIAQTHLGRDDFQVVPVLARSANNKNMRFDLAQCTKLRLELTSCVRSALNRLIWIDTSCSFAWWYVVALTIWRIASYWIWGLQRAVPSSQREFERASNCCGA